MPPFSGFLFNYEKIIGLKTLLFNTKILKYFYLKRIGFHVLYRQYIPITLEPKVERFIKGFMLLLVVK
jgi:hypothetical protein